VTEEEADRWRALGEFIRSQRQVAHLSLRQLSELARVSNPYLSQVERGLYKPSAEVLKAIADALEISCEALYARAGLLDSDALQAAVSVEDAVRMDARLTAEQKSALLVLYRSLVGTPSVRVAD
jgi:transcriptional regulator with XRE-family HTH domain